MGRDTDGGPGEGERGRDEGGDLQSEEATARLRRELLGLRRELEGGLRYAHVLMTHNQRAIQAQANVLNALGHVLATAGVVQTEAVQRARAAYESSSEQPRFRVRVAPDVDKYGPDVEVAVLDCADRLALCRGACCTQAFALGTQDLDEGLVRWQYNDPYVNLRRDDGRCVHQAEDLSCALHAHRPLYCRTYSCRNDTRIWLDFDRRIPNPALADRPPDLSAPPPQDEGPEPTP